MDLTLSQLRSVTLGALEVTEDADGFHFSRLTPRQKAAFTAADATFGPKCNACSGIRLDFDTDSDVLAVRWHKAQTTTRKKCYFDVLVDGVLLLHSGTEDCGVDSAGKFALQLPEGMKRVQIVLPALVGVCLASVTLSDGAEIRPSPVQKRILFHGDSIMQGYDAVFPSNGLPHQLGRQWEAETVSQAVGGAKCNPAVLEYVGDFDAILVGYGTNDWSKKTAEAFAADADAFYKKLKEIYPATPVFVVLPIWRADYQTKPNTAGDFLACRALLGQLAARQGFRVLDDFAMVPHDTRLLSDGYLHPNDLGFALYGQRLMEMLSDSGAL